MNKQSFPALAIIQIAALALCACASLPALNLPPSKPHPAISREKASKIASDYFFKYISGCGTTDLPVWKNGTWRVFYESGYVPVRGPHPIIISGETGSISCIGYPTIRAKEDKQN
jgi:hypothetical protein